MVKRFKYLLLASFIFSSCSSLKTLTFTNNQKPEKTNTTAGNSAQSAATEKKDLKFLEDISAAPSPVKTVPGGSVHKPVASEITKESSMPPVPSKPGTVESASTLQLKYAILLNTEVENVSNIELLKKIDEWYGTKYCLGGTTSRCIDCSAFMQVLFASVYGVSLPRTAREQYMVSTKISRIELKEGDMVFFNTRGGVSHVGFYLQNNKFVHASTSGVMISDLFDPYYLRRFIGVGRVEKTGIAGHNSSSGTGR